MPTNNEFHRPPDVAISRIRNEGFDLDDVTDIEVLHTMKEIHSQHANGPWQPGSIYLPAPSVIRFKVDGQEHEIPLRDPEAK